MKDKLSLLEELIKAAIYALLISIVVAVTLTINAHADLVHPKYKIAIIDTGYLVTFPGANKLKLCPTGHYDFGNDKPGIGVTKVVHRQTHGTFVGMIIAEELKDVDYCALIYQVQNSSNEIPTEFILAALKMATEVHATLANLSYVMYQYDLSERWALRDFLATGTHAFVAAGNNSKNLDESCDAYPACYPLKNLYAVGAFNPILHLPDTYSNYGSVINLWFSGDVSFNGIKDYGTSFAAPRALVDYVLRQDKLK